MTLVQLLYPHSVDWDIIYTVSSEKTKKQKKTTAIAKSYKVGIISALMLRNTDALNMNENLDHLIFVLDIYMQNFFFNTGDEAIRRNPWEVLQSMLEY